MNEKTLNTLNYNEIKELVKTYCVSNLGKELIDKITPSYNLKQLNHWLNETSEARNLIDNGYNISLKGISDINYIVDKLEKGMTLEIDDLLHTTDFLRGCNHIKRFFDGKEDYAKNLTAYSMNITLLSEVEEEINYTIKGSDINTEATKELKKIRRHMEICEGKIKEKLEKFINNSTNKKYIQDSIILQRNNKYVVPVKAMYKNKVEGVAVDVSGKGSTVFIEPSSVAKHSSELEVLKVEEQVEIFKVLALLTEKVYEHIYELKMNIDVIAKYDMIFAKGKYSAYIGGVKPALNQSGVLNIKNGVHPLIENFQPLNFNIATDYRGLLITGPNAGGKTVVLKTVGLLTLMTMSGFHIKASKDTEISVFQNIFVDIGDNQSIENSLSTFSSHMNNLSDILKNSNKQTLVLLDEIGSGTEPTEGAGLAISILEHLYKKGVIVLATTHYGEVKTFAEEHIDFEIGAMDFEKDTLEPLYKLRIGKAGNSNAFYIAQKMGIPLDVREKALRYIKTKDYDTKTLVDESKVIKYERYNSNYNKYENLEQFTIGDKVKINQSGDVGIIYKTIDNYGNVKIFIEDSREIVSEHSKMVTLLVKAKDLYPDDYDINTLFIDFKTRKLEKDIQRGSKKALKKIAKDNLRNM